MPANVSRKERIILGIDPGTRIMGFGVIKAQGSRFSLMETGVLNLRKEGDTLLRLEKIHEEIIRIIEKHAPDYMAIETPFYGKNVQSLIKLGRAQGVAIAAALSLQVPVFEYAPLKIKQSLTGKGSASKEQVCAMVLRILNMKEGAPRFLDATDALAAAICHALHSRIELDGSVENPGSPKRDEKKIPGGRSPKNSWADFIARNPDRIDTDRH